MGDDVITGSDGTPRCAWAGAGDTAPRRYHDEVWGTRTYDEPALFEALTLGVFEAGLSWSIVFGKRDGFRKAFHGFDVEQVAAMSWRPSRGRMRATVSVRRDHSQTSLPRRRRPKRSRRG
jgi:DNA-3-methyladenine glycosylase I